MRNAFMRPWITSRLRVEFHAVDCIFRAGFKCENRNVYLNSETQVPYQQGVIYKERIT